MTIAPVGILVVETMAVVFSGEATFRLAGSTPTSPSHDR